MYDIPDDAVKVSWDEAYEQSVKLAEFRTGQLPPPELINGKDIVVVDELCETGRTLQFITDYLKDNGAGMVRSGVIHYKPPRVARRVSSPTG